MLNIVTSIGVTNLYLDVGLDRHTKSFYKLTLVYHDGKPAYGRQAWPENTILLPTQR